MVRAIVMTLAMGTIINGYGDNQISTGFGSGKRDVRPKSVEELVDIRESDVKKMQKTESEKISQPHKCIDKDGKVTLSNVECEK